MSRDSGVSKPMGCGPYFSRRQTFLEMLDMYMLKASLRKD